MEAHMNARIFYAAAPLALLLAAGANAQTVLQRPLELTQDQQTTVYRTIVRENVTPQARPAARKTVKTVRTPSGKLVRTTTTERVVTRPAPIVAAQERVTRTQPQQRVVARQPATTFVTADPLDLSQDQRTFVYRTLAQPAPVVSNRIVAPAPRPYVATEPVVTTAPVEQRVISTIDPTFGERVITTAPVTTGVGTVVTAPGAYSEIAIGSRIPPSVQLYAMPVAAATAAPAIAGYNYALIDNRVYLVDPRDGIVVGMLYQ
jgi:hypothetical protein